MNSLEYKSFLLRLWRENTNLSPQANWEAEVEYIQSGERLKFSTTDEILKFFEHELSEAKDPTDS
jgi:hypothetical protein